MRDPDLKSVGAVLERLKGLLPPEPPLLITDSLETLEDFAERLRAEIVAHDGGTAAGLEVLVTQRNGLPDLVRFGALAVIVDRRAPAGQVFMLRPPVERLRAPSLDGGVSSVRFFSPPPNFHLTE